MRAAFARRRKTPGRKTTRQRREGEAGAGAGAGAGRWDRDRDRDRAGKTRPIENCGVPCAVASGRWPMAGVPPCFAFSSWTPRERSTSDVRQIKRTLSSSLPTTAIPSCRAGEDTIDTSPSSAQTGACTRSVRQRQTTIEFPHDRNSPVKIGPFWLASRRVRPTSCSMGQGGWKSSVRCRSKAS